MRETADRSTGSDSIAVRSPRVYELEAIRELRHRVLDPMRVGDFELRLGAHDFADETVHMAAFDGDRLVSTVRFDNLADRGKPGWFEARKMATDPEYQRRGIGARVMRAAEVEAVRRGATDITLDARHEAVNFYAELGYEATGREVVHGDEIPNYTMVRHLYGV